MEKRRRWFTCTPFPFKGDQVFFNRDSGLLCRGFQAIGVECKTIMPGPPQADDVTADLIRTDYPNLEDPAWWRTLGAEGVVFYGWGSGKYFKVARAIKQAGLILVTHMDTGGVFTVFNGLAEYGGALWRITMGEHGHSIGGAARFVVRLGNALTLGVIRNDWPRSRHLKTADVIGTTSPIAIGPVRKACRAYGGEALAAKVQLVPHPCASYMVPLAEIPRQRLVVAIGRWDDAKVKGTDLLLATAEKVCAQDRQVVFDIYGRQTEHMVNWHAGLPEPVRQRIRLAGVVPNREVEHALQRAKVSLCTSLRESYHGVSAEALCCGCSVVGPDAPEIPSMKWFTDGPYGRMGERTADGLAAAVLGELAAWDAGERDPQAMGVHWGALLHTHQVAARILKLVEGRAVGSGTGS